MDNSSQTFRRDYLKAAGTVGAVGLAGLAGCSSGGGGSSSPIPVGSILPVTGSLSAYGEGMQTAVQAAVDDINTQNGILGQNLSLTQLDSETNPNRAVQKYNTLVSENNVVGFVGAASSGVSTTIAENVADDQVMQVSNASTSPVLADAGVAGDLKYFARTAPNDGQQGIVMARILENDQYVGADSIAVLHVDNAYGAGLAEQVEQNFGGTTQRLVGYGQQTTDYTSTLDTLFQDDPDAIGFVGYPGNGSTILNQWSEGGYGGDWVLSEGLNSETFLADNSDITSGMYISSPKASSGPGADAFMNKMRQRLGTQTTTQVGTTVTETTSLPNLLFAAHAYDAMALMGLALGRGIANDASASGQTIAENIRAVSRPGGSTYTVGELREALDAIEGGNEINYQGASSSVDLSQNLEPLVAMSILEVGSDGSTTEAESFPAAAFAGDSFDPTATPQTTTSG
jgi:branched-chain amino acid transport system substrate-binding protein